MSTRPQVMALEIIAEAHALLFEAEKAVRETNFIYAEALLERAGERISEQDVFAGLVTLHVLRLLKPAAPPSEEEEKS